MARISMQAGNSRDARLWPLRRYRCWQLQHAMARVDAHGRDDSSRESGAGSGGTQQRFDACQNPLWVRELGVERSIGTPSVHDA